MRLTLGLAIVGVALLAGAVCAEPAWEVYLSKTQDHQAIDIKDPVPVRDTVFVAMDDVAAAAGATIQSDEERNRVVVVKGDHTRAIRCNFTDLGARKINGNWYCAHDVMAGLLFGQSYFSRGQSEINMVVDVEGD